MAAAIAPKQFAPQAQKFNVKRDLVVKDGRFEWKYRKGNTTPTPTYKPPVTSKPVTPKPYNPRNPTIHATSSDNVQNEINERYITCYNRPTISTGCQFN